MDKKTYSAASSTTDKPIDATHRPRGINIQMVQNILLVWLDNNINEDTADCQNTITQLRQTMNSINTFTDDEKCIKFLESIDDDKVCMIISGSLGQIMVPKIHDLVQVDSIFIFCKNKKYHETWTKNWPKIKGIFTEITPICEALTKTAHQCEQDSMPISFVNTSNSTALKDQIEPSFMYTTILKEILLTIEFEENHIEDYINYCRNAFKDNQKELQNIEKFEQEHANKSSIWWYTYECFLYRMLNLGLRKLDGDIIIRMGFFIADLHRQIDELHKEQFDTSQSYSQFVVYRGQGMTKTEFDKLQQTKGGLLSFNNFLSTSKKREVSMRFARNGAKNPDNVGILFVMTIQPDQSTIPFASIAHISNYGPSEDEMLFAMHSVFRINDIKSMIDNPNIFIVDLTLTTDSDKDLQTLTDRIREECFPDARGWYRLGSVLYKMGQFDKAQQIYEMILERETVESFKAPVYNQLGLMKYQQGEYEKAISFYEKSISIEEKKTPLPNENLSSYYNNIGGMYSNMGEHAKALSYYEKSRAIQEQSISPNYSNLAASYNNIGNTYFNMNDYTGALSNHEKSLAFKKKLLPFNHPDLASSYNNIGVIYKNLGDYAKALSNYKESLAIRQISLSPNHPDLASTYNNMGVAYESMKNYSKALSFYEKAFDIARNSLLANHPHREIYENNLDRIKNQI